VQASSYYRFLLLTLLATGLFFQIPVAVIGLTRTGIVSTRQLRKHRRHAIVGLVAPALLLPGTAVVTTFLEPIPCWFFTNSACSSPACSSAAPEPPRATDHSLGILANLV
jgi:Sec-independent protein secretion pathway component TatC